MLTVHCLEVTVEAATPLALDAYCGSALRGAFFHAIWGRFCTNRESPTCDVCPLISACPVAALVAPLRDEAPRGRDMPRPYIITPPQQKEAKQYEQGETFSFGFTLIGQMAKLYPYVIRAFQEMEQNNLGHPLAVLHGKRGKILVREIHSYHPFTGERQLLWQRGDKRPEALHLCVTPDDVATRAAQLPLDHLVIYFLSPSRLVVQQKVLHLPNFAALIARLAQRLEQVQQEYSQPTLEAGKNLGYGKERYLLLKEQAARVQLDQNETTWMDIQSYSTRQRQGMPIGGLVGRASFVGDMSQFRELLAWGEVLHVGKNIVKGGGAYRLEI